MSIIHTFHYMLPSQLYEEVELHYYQEIQQVQDDVKSGGDFEISLKIHMHCNCNNL